MSAFSISEPFPQFHDRAGQPLDGGSVWIGVAGLDAQANPVPVFFDAALTIPAQQPIGTRSGFSANGATPTPIYVDADDYSIKILDANGTLVSSYPNAAERFPAAIITGGLSSANVTYDRDLPGTQVRTVESRLRDYTSVFDFMTPAQIAAVQSSLFTVDVTAPVQAAINSLAREVYFPQGGYLISAPLVLFSPTVAKTLRGAGRQSSIIFNIGAGDALQSIGNPITQNTAITIADLSVESQPGSSNGIFFEYTSQATIERVGLYGHAADGIRIENGAHIAIVDCWSRSNTGNALRIGGEAYFVDVRGGTFESSQDGVEIDIAGGALAPRFLTFTGCAFRGNTNANVNIGQARDVRFFGCSFESPGSSTTTRHLSIDGGAGLAANIVVDACSIFGTTGPAMVGVYAATCEDVAVTNSVVDCTGAIALDIAATAQRTRLVNNGDVLGTQTIASGSNTTQVLSSGTLYALRRDPGFSAFTRFDFGDGPARFDTTLLQDAFRFYAVNAVSIFPIQRFDTRRVWFNPLDGFMYVKDGSDPAFTNDGAIVNADAPLRSYARGSLPGGANGVMIRGTNYAGGAAWGALESGIAAGGDAYLFVRITGGWKVFGQAS